MSAGAFSRYVETNEALEFREWMAKKLSQDQPFVSKRVVPSGFEARALDRMRYHAVLNRLAQRELLGSFIDAVQAGASSQPSVRRFLWPVIFTFSALSYYAGLLTRKAKLSKREEYYLHFCGNGGQLLLWMPRGKEIVEYAFISGLVGPEPSETGLRPNAVAAVSKYPKQEVGRGLLIDRSLHVMNHSNNASIFDISVPPVTVGEAGFAGVEWDSNLSFEILSSIKNSLPPLDQLKELHHFAASISKWNINDVLPTGGDLQKIILSDRFGNTLRQRLADNLAGGRDAALVEPLFITEAKCLLEITTGLKTCLSSCDALLIQH